MTARNSYCPSYKLFFSLSFAYAIFVALLLQKVVLPLLPEFHAGDGLLSNDAVLFHNNAVELARRISQFGWSEWTVFSGVPGNVAILAAIYAVFGPDPAFFIPLNAGMHALGALLVYRMGQRIWPGEIGVLGGFAAGLMFLVFPSALQWYGQNHKDAFAIVGLMLILEAWLGVVAFSNTVRTNFLWRLLATVMGISLIGLVRPYFTPVLIIPMLLSLFVCLACAVYSKYSWKEEVSCLAHLLVLLLVVASLAFFFTRVFEKTTIYADVNIESTQHYRDLGLSWQWQRLDGVPLVIDKLLERASQIRLTVISYGRSVQAESEIDGGELPSNALEFIAYMPRSLVVGLFSPFPSTWSDKTSVPRLVGAIETGVWYIFFIGLPIALLRRPNRSLFAGLVFCLTMLAVLAYIHPNVGTLYRQRFGVWQFVLLCGSVGWASLILSVLRRPLRLTGAEEAVVVASRDTTESVGIERVVASSMIFVIISLACYLGFFARDLLVMKQLGIGPSLDAFFTAAMIPMFFVTFLAIPMADAMMKPFLSVEIGHRAVLVGQLLGFTVMLLGGVTLLVIVSSPYLVGAVLGEMDSEKAQAATFMMRWFASLILLSAWTVIGNAVLNGLGQSRVGALGQLVVPVLTVAALVIAPPEITEMAAIGGMLLGTLLNSVWVFSCLRALGITMLPTFPVAESLLPIISSYRRLVFASLLTAVLVPMNYAFAASMPTGGLSAWVLSSKIVALFSGLLGTSMSAVVLPHLVRLLTTGSKQGMRDDGRFMLVVGNSLGALLAIAAFVFAEPLLGATLSGGLSQEQLSQLAGIVKVGVLQLPLAIVGLLLTKMAIVSGVSSRVFFAAALGFVSNLAIDFMLVPHFGVLGVAIGALAAMALSTLCLLILARKLIELSWSEVLILIVNWVVLAVGSLAFDSRNQIAILFTALVIIVLAWLQFLSFRGALLSRIIPCEDHS